MARSGLIVDFSNGPYFPLYWHKCPHCEVKLGPWLNKSDAVRMMKDQQSCDRCYRNLKFSPQGTTP